MISIRTPEEIQIMAEGGRILAEIIKKLTEAVGPGIATKVLDQLARELCSSYNVKPAFLGYGGFPASVCISINDEVVHGVPGDRILKEGDLVGIDMGIVYKGFITDSAVTVPVLGNMSYKSWVEVNPAHHKLIETAKEALAVGIKHARSGKRVGEIGSAIQKLVESRGFGVVRDLVGHGVGQKLHEDPPVPNYGSPTDGPELVEGMVLAIEPMITAGDYRVKLAPDGFTYKTQDGSLSAHFEHTVAVTRKGAHILT